MKRIVAILLIVLCFTLSACSALSLEEEDILAVPKASGDESEVISLIASNFSSSFELVYPLSGANKNAVTICDTGKDVIEAIAVFRTKDEPGTAELLFARKINDSFTYLGSSAIPTNVIDRVDFADLDGDGKREILVGYQGASSSLKSIAIYRTEDEISVTDVTACYSRCVLGDFNSDGADEVLCVTTGAASEPPFATLMGYHPDRGLLPIADCELNPEAQEIENLLFGNIAEDIPGVMIDERLESGAYTTEALYYDKGQKLLINPLFIFETAENAERSEKLLSKDINSDGILEIPTVEKAPIPENAVENAFCNIVVWKDLDFSSYSMQEKKTALICPDGKYTFTLTEDKKDCITAQYSEEERKMTLYSLDFDREDTQLSHELLYIKAYSRDDYQENKVIEAKLYELSAEVYTFLITNSDDEYAFTDTEVEKSFEILQGS